MSENREPQNIESRMLNIEGQENFIIRNSLFDIGYSKWEMDTGCWSLTGGFRQPQPATSSVESRAALRSGFHLSSDLCPLNSVKGVLQP
jgi:hypothetical protein